jgi:hypothetical protein
VSNDRLNVAKGFASTSKIGYFGRNRTKNKIFYLIHTCKPPNNLKRDGPGCKICQKNFSILDIVNAFLLFHKNVANGLIYSPQLSNNVGHR